MSIKQYIQAISLSLLFSISVLTTSAQETQINFELSIPNPELKNYEVTMHISDYYEDSLVLKMPVWMPGYYQVMNYSKSISNIEARNSDGEKQKITRIDDNTWLIKNLEKDVSINYTIQTERKFVAQSYVDKEHAYIAPCNTWLYIDGKLDLPASVDIELNNTWDDIATGLHPINGTTNKFTAQNFDFLYDCPILIGNLEELETFYIQGIPHRFIGYKIGEFNKTEFISKLKKSVEAAVEMMGDIPYKEYTFLAIGPGMGGIEHLNNTTISFDGNRLNSDEAINSTLAFITHEYFHHYNVKRIRPLELGPFDYNRDNRTTQLWVSEGLTVYYEYILMKKAGLIDSKQMLQYYADLITASENDPGKTFQSLSESSYRTWDEGPFGVRGGKDTSITYYEKGPVVGLLLDLAIREYSQNKYSLDDVMRYLYNNHYKTLNRGFTDAEIQQICESMAGRKLDEIFEYITTTNPINYEKYLSFAGLDLETNQSGEQIKYDLKKQSELTQNQQVLLSNWLNE